MKETNRPASSLSTGDVTKTSATILEPHPAIRVPSHERNRGTPLDLDWVKDAKVNLSAVERRSTSLTGRRTVKKEGQAAGLVKAGRCIRPATLGRDGHGRGWRCVCATGGRQTRAGIM